MVPRAIIILFLFSFWLLSGSSSIVKAASENLLKVQIQKCDRGKLIVPPNRRLRQRAKIFKTDATYTSGEFDTGSAQFWIPSIECKSEACKSHSLFNPSRSKTFLKNADITWKIEYSDGDKATGYYAQDTIAIGSAKAVNATIGLALTESIGWKYQKRVDGIIGLGFPDKINTHKNRRGENLSYSPPPLIDVLFKQSQIPSRIFSVFFHQPDVKTGEYHFGGVDPNNYSGSITYVDLSLGKDPSYWIIPVENLKLYPDSTSKTQEIVIGGGHAMIDTGSTAIILPHDSVEDFHTKIKNAKFDATRKVWAFPCRFRNLKGSAISITLAGRKFDIQWKYIVGEPTWLKSDYKKQNIDEDYCESWVDVMDKEDTEWILGDAFLTTTYSIFDIDSRRVGFATPK
ncbi:hypothetical protein G9A89_005709 [Geosiphon pyriformis]|nr:hypothetical protein G9A89_005709 [Geosiphon pyriformis]